MEAGLTSITFRNKSISQITKLVENSGLSVIEWGGDVHCPPDNRESAKIAFSETQKSNLSVSSYGSYFRLGVNEVCEFEDICETAKLLHTDIVRIWGYNKDHDDLSQKEYEKCVKDAMEISDIAGQYGITVCFEYHRNTLTRSAVFAKKLIKDIGRENIRLYWQPNPEISHADNCKELEQVLPYVVNIHCFHWTWDEKNVRHPLSEGENEWKAYLDIAKKGNVKNILIEFVMNDLDCQFMEDAESIKSFIR